MYDKIVAGRPNFVRQKLGNRPEYGLWAIGPEGALLGRKRWERRGRQPEGPGDRAGDEKMHHMVLLIVVFSLLALLCSAARGA